MMKNQKDLQPLYQLVQKRYLILKKQSKCELIDEKTLNKSSICTPPNRNISSNSIKKAKTPSLNRQCEDSIQKSSQKSIKNYSEEFNKEYLGREKVFYQKYKNDLNAIKFLKYYLFSYLNQIEYFNPRISEFNKKTKFLSLQNLKKLVQKLKNYLNQSQILIFLLMGILLFGYNIWQHYQEIIMEKQTLDKFRMKYDNESEALYELQKQQYVLFEKIRRHKDQNLIQSLLNRKINVNFSCIFGTLFLVISLLKRHDHVICIKPKPLFSNLALRFDMDNQKQQQLTNDQNIDCQSNNILEQPNKISQIYNEQKIKKQEQFLQIFNDQKDYILKRKEEEQIKKDILENKKAEMMNQLKFLSYKNEKNKQAKIRRQSNTLSMGSFTNNSLNNQQNNGSINEQHNFTSKYYSYEQFHHSEDEDYDLPQFGQKLPISHLNKFPKRSKLLVNSLCKEPNSEPLHVRSRSNGSSFKIINTKNESESYKFCNRLY